MSEPSSGQGAAGDIAVIGLGCRFPGEAKSPSEFYKMLLNGRSGWSEVPKDRFNIDAFWHPSYDRKGTIVSRGAHFLEEDVGLFDAPFFSMTQAEANAMDPQHRMLLEITYETLENAGIPLDSVVGSDMACYVGGFTREYDTVCSDDLDDTLLYTTTGNGLTMMSNRLSWFYDMRGPSLTLDTACSSSLVALSLAAQNIRSSNSPNRSAIVAGSNLILIPDQMTTMNPLRFLSSDSQCYSFDDRANGYVRGEGIGVLLLKHIDDAIRDGDCVRGVIRNVVCNQDGKTPGITLPSSDAQLSLIRKAYGDVGLDMDETGYFEAHGTGTAAGDPLEVSAIAAAFRRHEQSQNPLLIGSVKPNIGHLEAGAGMAGLIKTILALENGIIPGNILFENANPRLGLVERNLKVVQGPTPWPKHGLRRASVNSFGYGGTNAHCIIDDAFHYLTSRGVKARCRTNALPGLYDGTGVTTVQSDSGFVSEDSDSSETVKHGSKQRLYVLSAPDQAALGRLCEVHANYLQERMDQAPESTDRMLSDLAYTYSERRTGFSWRKAVVASKTASLIDQLRSESKTARSARNPSILFCFTGQGAQWYRMGRELLKYETFARSVQAADEYLISIGSGWRASDELGKSKEASLINSPEYSQPLCTVLQVALVDLLRHWGIVPASVVGHSSGEIAAAYAAGAFSAEECWKIAFFRGKLSQEFQSRHPGKRGGMIAVGLSRASSQEYIDRLDLGKDDVLAIACVNSPESTTVSGDQTHIERLEFLLKKDGVFARKLAVENAYHSKHMELLADDYREALEGIVARSDDPKATMYSSVTGTVITLAELGAEYWVKNMVSPVLFDDAVQASLAVGGGRRQRNKAGPVKQILEIGPHAALLGPVRQILQDMNKGDTVTSLAVLRRNEDAETTALSAAGALWARGVPVHVHNVNSPSDVVKSALPLVDLPKYPWNHTIRYWHESSLSKSQRFRHSPRTDLLGEPVKEFSWEEPAWKNYIYISEQPWIADHVVRGRDVYPAAGMICAAIEAVKQCALPGKVIKSFELRDVTVKRALMIPASDAGVEVFTRLRPQRYGTKGTTASYDFNFTSLEKSNGTERKYVEHCAGRVAIVYEDESETTRQYEQARVLRDRASFWNAQQHAMLDVTAEEHYEAVAKLGIVYGPTFQGIKAIRAGDGEATFDIELQDTRSLMPSEFEYPFVVHPTFVDAAIQAAYQGLTHDRHGGEDDTVVPTEFRHIRVHASMPNTPGTMLAGLVQSSWTSRKDAQATIKIGHRDWTETLLELGDCTFTGLADADTNAANAQLDRRLATKYVWKPLMESDPHSAVSVQRLLEKDLETPEFIGTHKAASTQAAFIYIQRAVRSLTPEIEDAFEGHWIPFVRWMKMRYEQGLNQELFGQKASSEDWRTMTHDREEEFLHQVKHQYPEDVNILCAVGNALPEILAGTQQPLPIMLVDDMLSKFYADASGMASGLVMYRNVFELLGHQNPGMKILEIGGGTGSVTLPILNVLGGQDGRTPCFQSYTFTDISTGWFPKAQELFKPWASRMEYQKLDIEADDVLAEGSGLQAESYDIIVASNVLHATKRLNVTLSNCLKLLKPGGKLVLGELTVCPDNIGLVFGTLPGWWLSEDGREGGPMVSQEGWDVLFRACGFTGLDVAAAAEDHEGNKMISTMIATKPKMDEHAQLRKVVVIEPAVDTAVSRSIIDAAVNKFQAGSVEALQVSLLQAAELADHGQLTQENTLTVSLLEAVDAVFDKPSERIFNDVRKVITQSNTLIWYNCNGDVSGVLPAGCGTISGLLRTARSENPMLRSHKVQLQERSQTEADITATKIWWTASHLWSRAEADEYESEISEIRDCLNVPRLVDDEPLNKIIRSLGKVPPPEWHVLAQAGRPLRIQMAKNSRVDSLHFVSDTDHTGQLPDHHIQIDVKANGVNASDIAAATGKRPDLLLGIDAAGVVSSVGSAVTKFAVGDRVALAAMSTWRTQLRVHEDYAQLIPSYIGLEEAAAIPFVYMTAYQGMKELGRLRAGETVFITRAASSLGQALISLARPMGANVIVAAETDEQRLLLRERFHLPGESVLDSNSHCLSEAVRDLTKSRGVDLCLDILGGEHLSVLCSCLAPFGRFINFNLEDVQVNAPVGIRYLGQNASFMTVNTRQILVDAPRRASELLAEVFALLRSRAISPGSPQVFNYTRMAEAFVAAQSPAIMDKVVLKFDETSEGNVVPIDQHPLELRGDATYVLSGGLGGIGRALACYLADHGARNIVLLSRSTEITGKAAETMQYLADLSVRVKVIACDVTVRSNIEAAISEISTDMPPIKGLVHGAMVLRDGLFENMTHEQWTETTKPKVEGTWNLHEAMPKDLDFFIMLSSIAGIVGNPGQSNYNAGNSYQDAFCHYRRSLGLKACTIDVGGVGGFGWLDENKENKAGASFADLMSNLTINPEELFSMIKSAITGYTSWGRECPTQLVTGIGTGGMSAAHVAAGGNSPYYWLSMQGRFAYLRHVDLSASVQQEESAVQEFKKDLAAAKTMAEAGTVVEGALMAKLARSLMIAPSDIDTGLPMSSYGVDSLVAADLRNWCAREIKATVSIFEFLNAVPIAQLALQVAESSALVSVTS